ncbi:MAG: hypothetical protein ABF876_12635 [Acetobacter aceti]|uniref:Uncharacterized protein n=1 Tax=Acetobacter aceti TaxID=435 RepID=A0A1U9KF41_ACEAC|nr:hypothetical protein [Acetobacter aceti]AQS84420.1 hypothetical protein A0U92_06130 [Acetobacter aceti]
MNTATEFTAEWHLERSRPEQLLSYLDLAQPFVGQINKLIARFRDVQFLCEHGTKPELLLPLRDALAFNLVKMSRWWSFDFCPRSILEMQAPRFLGHVKEHLRHSYDDDALYDVFTTQRYLHPGSPSDVLVVGHDPEPDLSHVLYGVDGQRRFRVGSETPDGSSLWHNGAYSDFAGAWLAARAVNARESGDREAARDASLAQAEHEQTRLWHQRHFHACCERHVVTLYADAKKRLMLHKSAFGRMESETVINSLAFRVARFAVHSGMTITDLIRETAPSSSQFEDSIDIERRARTHVFTSVDETRQTVQLAVVDRLGSYRPRHCC